MTGVTCPNSSSSSASIKPASSSSSSDAKPARASPSDSCTSRQIHETRYTRPIRQRQELGNPGGVFVSVCQSEGRHRGLTRSSWHLRLTAKLAALRMCQVQSTIWPIRWLNTGQLKNKSIATPANSSGCYRTIRKGRHTHTHTHTAAAAIKLCRNNDNPSRLYLLEQVRRQPGHVHAHVLLQHLGQVGEERVAVLVQLGAVELQTLLGLPARACVCPSVCDNTKRQRKKRERRR